MVAVAGVAAGTEGVTAEEAGTEVIAEVAAVGGAEVAGRHSGLESPLARATLLIRLVTRIPPTATLTLRPRMLWFGPLTSIERCSLTAQPLR